MIFSSNIFRNNSRISSPALERGSVLLTGLIVALTVGIALASFLTLISNRYRMTMRSLSWNKVMPVLESGIEEALTHLHDDYTNLTANGWKTGTVSGVAVINKYRTNSDGSYFWTVVANYSVTNPIITSSGFVPAPVGKGYITRTVQVNAGRPVQFSHAVAATGLISLNGSPGLVDSYNSCYGIYGGTNALGSQGSIATSYNASPAISIGNSKIYGTANTGAGGTISSSPNGAIGSSNWIAGNPGTFEPGWTNDTMNVFFPSNYPPTNSQSWSAPPTVTSITNLTGLTGLTNLSGVTSATVLSGGNYKMSSYSCSSITTPMIVTGPSVLYITGTLNISGTGAIEIASGGSLTVYVGGSSTTISGTGVVNSSLSPENFTYVGLAGNTSITFNGSVNFYGTINAPQADFTMNGNDDMFGATIVKSFTNHGAGNIHYDACLGMLGNLVVASWKEL